MEWKTTGYSKYKNWKRLTKLIGDQPKKCSLHTDVLEYAAQEAV